MGRYQPPRQRGSKYITPEGRKTLFDELEHLLRVERPRVTQQVSEAAALGDRSENAEYIYGKKQLREIDWRIRFLQKRLDVLKIVDRPPSDASRVYFGAWVRLGNEAGNIAEYRIVGADELDLGKSYISIDSPLARALLKKTIDDDVTVLLPHGQTVYTILEISYSTFEKTG